MKRYIIPLLLLLMPLSASARLLAIRDSVANGYNFWLYVPKQYKDHRADRAKMVAASAEKVDSLAVDTTSSGNKVPAGLPIIVFLHGRSLSGTNLHTVRKYGTIDAISRGRTINAIVIAPQVQVDESAEGSHMIIVVASFRGCRGVNTVLFRRILVGRSCPPYTGIHRNADVRQRLLYLLHPLTPLAREAFRPR